MLFDNFLRFIKLDKTTQNYTRLHKYYTNFFELLEQKNETEKEKIMPRKPEPKITFQYVENHLSIEEQKIMYEKFIKHLVKVVKEQEELENNCKS